MNFKTIFIKSKTNLNQQLRNKTFYENVKYFNNFYEKKTDPEEKTEE